MTPARPTRLALAAALTALVASVAPRGARCEDAFTVRGVNTAREQHDREVDEAAVHSQERAIARVKGLLSKYRGDSRQEPILLGRLGEMQSQMAAIIFRIGHGQVTRKGGALDDRRHRTVVRASIATYTQLIERYPEFDEIAKAIFTRGRSWEDLGDKGAAARDYETLVRAFPDADETTSAYMSLAEFQIEAGNHEAAIKLLKEVERKPEDPRYPFALYKLAWSYYNLKDIRTALDYAQKQVAYYQAIAKLRAAPGAEPGNVLATSDEALRENTLLDATVFFFQGFEQGRKSGDETYALREALPFFERLESGPVLGRMLTRYAKLLRSGNHELELIAWKDRVIKDKPELPECVDVLLTVYEHQVNQRRYASLVDTARDLVKLYARHRAYDGFKRAQKALTETTDGLQQVIIKNKGTAEARGLSVQLAALYDSFTRIVEDSDPRIPRAHYNLAETHFGIGDFPGATTHYRWIVDHQGWGDRRKPDAAVADASLKAIAARYETLRSQDVIPKDLAPVALRSGRPGREGLDRASPLAEWIGWIDVHAERAPAKGTSASADRDFENFRFEANRALYRRGNVAEALARLRAFVDERPQSEFGIPSASLVLDTRVASEDWALTEETANRFAEVKAWKGSPFAARLEKVAADASYKQLEGLHARQEHGPALKGIERFLKRYGKSARLGDALALAGAAALKLGRTELALGYFERVTRDLPGTSYSARALVARAELRQKRFDFAAAARDLRLFAELPEAARGAAGTKDDEVRERALRLAWLGGEPAVLDLALRSPALCPETGPTVETCERLRALRQLDDRSRQPADRVRRQPLEAASTEAALARARKEDGAGKAIWAALALEGAAHLEFRDRNSALRHLAQGWEKLDALSKFALLPVVTQVAPYVYRWNREEVPKQAPLHAREKSIQRRVEVIREMENAGTPLLKLMPWLRVRAEVLSETASLYLDLARGLSALPAPKDLSDADRSAYEDTVRKLVMPFEEKGQELRGKAFELASDGVIEQTSLAAIAEPFFQENPSQARALRPSRPIERGTAAGAGGIGPDLLARLDPGGDWKKLRDLDDAELAELEDEGEQLRARWSRAYSQRRWVALAYLTSEGDRKLPAATADILKALGLAAAGAEGEAWATLAEARPKLAPPAASLVWMELVRKHHQAYAKAKTRKLLLEIDPAQSATLDSDLWQLAETALAWADPARLPPPPAASAMANADRAPAANAASAPPMRAAPTPSGSQAAGRRN